MDVIGDGEAVTFTLGATDDLTGIYYSSIHFDKQFRITDGSGHGMRFFEMRFVIALALAALSAK